MPKFFPGISETHVWSLVNLRPLADQIHDLLDRSCWRVTDFLILLQKNNIGPFKMETSLINFLKRRPKIFGVDSKHVWSMGLQTSTEDLKRNQNSTTKVCHKKIRSTFALKLGLVTLQKVKAIFFKN